MLGRSPSLSDPADSREEFFSQQIRRLLTSAVYHRRRQKLGASTLRMIEAQGKLYQFHVNKLTLSADFKVNLPSYDLESCGGNVEQFAMAVRHYWKVASGPIRNLTGLLEKNGIITVDFDFQTELIDGFFEPGTDTPCVVKNSRMPPDRQRFSLAHELGHLLLHDFMHDGVEEEANAFASAFLMPAEDIKDDLKNLTYK
nr:TPA_exp: PelG [uncultured bacterium]